MKMDIESLVPLIQQLNNIQDPILHCICCQDIGTYIWKCTNPDCGILACIDMTPDELTLVSMWKATPDTHSDTATGNLVVSVNAANSNSILVHELLHNYLGNNLWVTSQHIGKINTTLTVGPFICGIVISSCGSTGRVSKSIKHLKCLVEMNIFDFVFCFAGVMTINALIISTLNCFIENVFMYDMGIWAVLQALFGQDKHALNNTLVMLLYTEYWAVKGKPNTREHIIKT
ncbi:uncharacterized protein BJ212DRAFT_1304431 [Suillus subaureus]|uniref:Uncharacterized protein n=1 Tax=Suillus subaureus TaxID=48587 RepID=A0A9P7DVX3_9AGAM|nr:uncharacterized protein BJ212DRAFT_1304431 [Suillus subaureus]KAG1804132.1 hypothetical protein BJ212DRAFT_1304431 [Suillus subaureus]